MKIDIIGSIQIKKLAKDKIPKPLLELPQPPKQPWIN